MKEKIYVHVADDHKIIIEGIIALINTDKDIEIIGSSLTGQEVVDWFKVKENKADVLILDITMPILDGFEVLKYFKKKKKEQKVIILSSYDDLKIVQEVLDLGCKGYISKNSAGEHIVKAIKMVASGQKYFSPDIQSKLYSALGNDTVAEGEKPEKFIFENLTESELLVIKLVAREYSSIEMADEMNLSLSSIEGYRKKLLKKLNVKNSVGLAMYAVKYNIV
ncbi:MAG: response regulator [Polaribacter sp.]